ncbi:hypothetical protein, partial [Escherichia coli]|uniref:hypothetical protein n=1 Tax=Escherichia coli TaxID=562 RepID=UPI003F8649FC
AVMLLLSAWGLFDFWNWLQHGAGQKTVDILIRIALLLFFSALCLTVLPRFFANPPASWIPFPPLPPPPSPPPPPSFSSPPPFF